MDIEFNKNEDSFKQLCDQLKEKTKKVFLGGGEQKIKSEHDKGKLTARERITLLLDAKAEVQEIGAFAGEGMYEEFGGCPSGGAVVVIGSIHGRKCIVVANEIALENNIPIIYLVDSAGVFLPLQNEVFPDKEHFGRIFRNNARMSALGIPQIAAVMGSCVAGGAYLPIMSDEALIVDGTGSIFLAGSYLVKAAIGEDIDNETLGGATTHAEISGVIDYKCANDEACIAQIRSIVSKMGTGVKAGFNRIAATMPLLKQEGMYGILPKERNKPYDMLEIIRRLVDDSSFEQYKELYGQTLLCGYARIDGWSVGIVANQRIVVKTNKNEMQMGGVIYSDSADKAARFIMNCNQKKIPLVFLQDVSGFMVGSRSEQGGIIKDGAKMVNAMSNSVVPKFTVLIGNSFGAGNYAMCGKAFDPRLIVAWPTAEMAVMSGAAAAKTLLQIKVGSLKAKGKELSEADEKQLLDEIKAKYAEELSPYYAASRLWIDAVIDPQETRKVISIGIEIANEKPIDERFNVGIIQT